MTTKANSQNTRRNLLSFHPTQFVLLFSLLALCLPLLQQSAVSQSSEDEQPNIVFILTDDMGWNEPSINGGKEVLTPNIQRLADQGVQLTQFYTNAACSPTRAAFMTGRYAFRTGMDWRSEDFGKPSFLKAMGLELPINDRGMPTRRIYALDSDERTVAEALSEAGYFTSIVGKWHLGEWFKRHLPMAQGFDHQYGHYAWGVDYYDKMIPHNAPIRFAMYDWHRNQKPIKEKGYATDLIADEAERVISEQSDEQPFFMYVPFNAVHGPINRVPRYDDKYSPREAALKILDDGIGQILDALEDHGFAENTLVVFTNDNGGVTADLNDPYRGKKNTNYEGGVRVPTVAKWPGHIEPGTKDNAMMFISDLYATFISVAGGSLEQEKPLDSHDMTDVLVNGAESPREEIIFEVKDSVRTPAIRKGDYKLVGDELYNIAEDPYEKNNIAGDHPKLVKKLKKRLQEAGEERYYPDEDPTLMNPPLPFVYGQNENQNPPEWLKKIVKQKRLEQARSWNQEQTPWPQAPKK
jgi:arylsulfatase A-like enzyme